MDIRKIREEDIERVYTLNTWTDDKKEEVRKALETGKWVYLGSTAIGHTRAEMTERAGLKWLEEEYGNVIQMVQCEGRSDIVSRLR